MSDAHNDPERFVNRLRDISKEVGEKIRQEATEISSRVRSGAGRQWKLSNLRIEIGLLRRKRGRKLSELGQLTYELMRDDELDTPALRRLFDDVEDIDEEIDSRQRAIQEIGDQSDAEQSHLDIDDEDHDEDDEDSDYDHPAVDEASLSEPKPRKKKAAKKRKTTAKSRSKR